ncbi:MAG: hypothetical protein E7131_05295 [Rikenellaceae bacterium]|nr:hypothetical protein [Rikenellaceae bacterium]
MKRLLSTLFLLLFVSIQVNAQMVNEKGEKTYMANIAVVVNENIYNIDGGKMVKVRIPGRESLASAFTLYLSNHFAQNGFLVVNSDASINEKINAVISENKLEEYIDGLAVQAKNVGAQFIALLDYTMCMEDNKYVTNDFSFRYIDVNSNVAVHQYVSNEVVCYSADDLGIATTQVVEKFKTEFNDFFNTQFLPQFVVSEVDGKKTRQFATRQMPLYPNANIDYYKWYYENAYFQGKEIKFCCLDYLASSAPFSKAKMDNQTGAIQLTSDKPISVNPQEILATSGAKWFSVGTSLLPQLCTFVELPYDENSSEGYVRKSVNQAVYNALSTSPNHIMIIESDLLPELKQERERQKAEAFLYAENNTRKAYLDKFKTGAFGAQFLLDIDDFKVDKDNWKKVSFTLNCHFVDKNAVHKSTSINCHISNLKEVLAYHINEYFMTPITIASIDKKTLSVYTPLYLHALPEEVFYLYNYIETDNPVTGEVSYQRVPIAEYKYIEWKGQKHNLELVKVLNKDIFGKVEELRVRDKESRANFSLLKKMEEPIKVDKDNSAFAKSQKTEKMINALSKFGSR